MQDGIDVAVEVAGQQAIEELLLVEVVGDVAIDEIAELVGRVRLSTAMILRTPRSLSALTRFEPMKPARR
jgi:hypothetical protein